ncbi:MAG: hypothetical protein MUQ00_02870 [Candidatus Aminicenantes bacterium]|nr:hypothetical protein [Candidatus Aminicenantes bacterium]
MKNKLIGIGLLVLFFGVPAAAGDPDDDDVFYKFVVYTQKVYLTRALENMDPNDFGVTLIGKLFSARVLGYSLGNLLQYTRRGSENHKIWLMLERKTKEAMFSLIDREGAREGWDRAFIEKRRQNALAQFMGAQQGWYDTFLVTQTGVQAKEAPNFFETLAIMPPSPPPVQPPAPPRDEPSAPPIQPPVPPAPSSDDAVAGAYKVIGKSWVNDPRCGSLVTITGSMNEVEAEFKLWDWTGVTWHYKGPAKWDGKTWNTWGKSVRELKGKTQDLKNPHIFHGLTLKLTPGADGLWRADTINIGGNLFQIEPVQSTERPMQAKTLTIKNTTAAVITVYLDSEEGFSQNKLGTVNPRSETKFIGIPERGRWYLKIFPAPDTYPNSHTFLLYVKESEPAYFYEVLEWHLK